MRTRRFFVQHCALTASLVGLGLAQPSTAQVPGIHVGPMVHISASHPADPFVETLLAINPRDPRNLVATSAVIRDGERSDVYASMDGGLTWVQGRAPVGDTLMFRGGDPVVFFD